MPKKFDWMKRGLMGSTTLPLGTAGASLLSMPHVHAADGSCCGHDHSHDNDDHGHHHGHQHGPDCNHDHDEDATSPKGGCC
jgi:hypothetical protein